MPLFLTLVQPDLNLIPQPFFYVVAGLFGLIFGSFLNVVIYRLPREESIVLPSSRCTSCGAVIAFYDNLPVISYLVLRGRCRSCKSHISARYPAVETLTALLWMTVYWRDGLSWVLPFDLIFVTAILALIFINADQMILPNAITFPGVVFALIARVGIPLLTGEPHFDDMPSLMNGVFNSLPLWLASAGGGVLGGLLGGLSLWLIAWVWEKMRGVELLGLGNVKMMLMVGTYLGWRLTILTLLLSLLGVIGVILLLRPFKRDMFTLLPSGVLLGIGAITSLLIGSSIVERYAGQFR